MIKDRKYCFVSLISVKHQYKLIPRFSDTEDLRSNGEDRVCQFITIRQYVKTVSSCFV